MKVIAGCSASPRMWWAAAGSKTSSPWRPLRVGDELAGLPGAGGGQPGDERGQGVVGDGEEHQLRAADHLVGVEDGYAGEQPGGPLPRGVADPETATTRWPTLWRAAPSTAPTRPAPTTPTSRRAGVDTP